MQYRRAEDFWQYLIYFITYLLCYRALFEKKTQKLKVKNQKLSYYWVYQMYNKIFKIDKMAFEPILKDFDRKYLFHELIREKVCNVFFKSHTSEPNISVKV